MACSGITVPVGPNSEYVILPGNLVVLYRNISMIQPPLLSTQSIKTVSFLTQGVYIDALGNDITTGTWPGLVVQLGNGLYSYDSSVDLRINFVPSSLDNELVPLTNDVGWYIPQMANNQCSYIFVIVVNNDGSSTSITVYIYNIDSPGVVAYTGTVSVNMSAAQYSQLSTWNFKLYSGNQTYQYRIVGVSSS